MLDLIPSLLAQQTTKQAIQTPTPPIEPASLTDQKSSLSLTPVSAIAVPEPMPSPSELRSAQTATPNSTTPTASTAIPIAVPPPSAPTTPLIAVPSPAPSVTPDSTSSPAPSQVALPPLLEKSQATPIPSESINPEAPNSQASNKSDPANLTQPQATPTVRSSPLPQPSSSTSTLQKPNAQTVRVEPVKPTSAASTPQDPALLQQRLLLEQRLSEIVANDRARKQAAQTDTLITRAYSLATARRFDQARKLLQNPSIPIEQRNQVLTSINALESASRSMGVTKIAEPIPANRNSAAIARSKPAQPSKTAVRVVQPQPVTPANRSMTSIAIQVPRAIQSLPAPQLKSRQAYVNEPSTPLQSDPSIDTLTDSTPNSRPIVVPDVNTLQAYNRNLNLRGDKILYPLPEPVPVTSKFGWRIHPITQARRFHSGVDLGAAQGTPVLASKAGRVTVADRMGGYGLAIVMQNNDGTQDTLYAHLSQILVRPGTQIQPGMVIGRVGSTGFSTGPHLHYEARRMMNGAWKVVDPGMQLEAAKVRLIQARRSTPQASLPDEQS